MKISGDSYKINFSSKDVKEFKKIFATFLTSTADISTLPDFKVSCSNERIMIQMPATQENIAFIAQIIQQIDDFSMTFVSGKDTLAANTAKQSHNLNGTNQIAESEDIGVAIETDDTDVFVASDYMDEPINSANKDETIESNHAKEVTELEDTDDDVDTDDVNLRLKLDDVGETIESDNEDVILDSDDEKVTTKSAIEQDVNDLANKGVSPIEQEGPDTGRNSKVKKVRDYILSLESFTTKDLKQQFPDLSGLNDSTISNAIYLAKNKGLIKPVGRGKYVVNRN